MSENIVPILMTTYNRPDYFNQTIKSLERSGENIDWLYVADDCSDNEAKKALLKMYEHDHTILKAKKNMGTVKNTVMGIKFIRDMFEPDLFVLAQDDILVNKNWFSKGVGLAKELFAKHHNIAMLSLYNRVQPENVEYSIMKHGHPGFVANIFNNRFFDEYFELFPQVDYMVDILGNNDQKIDHKMKNLVDYKLCNRMHRMGWHIAVIGKSLVQHVGKESTLSNKDMSFCTVNNFVGE